MDPDERFLEALKASQNASAPHTPASRARSDAPPGAVEEGGDYVVKPLPSAEVRIPGRGAIESDEAAPPAPPMTPPVAKRASGPLTTTSASGAAPAMRPIAKPVPAAPSGPHLAAAPAAPPIAAPSQAPSPSSPPASAPPSARAEAQRSTPSARGQAERPSARAPAAESPLPAECAVKQSQDGIATVWDVFLPRGSGVVVKLTPRRATFFMGSERVLAPHVTWRSADAIATDDVRAFARTLLAAADAADRLPQVTVEANTEPS